MYRILHNVDLCQLQTLEHIGVPSPVGASLHSHRQRLCCLHPHGCWINEVLGVNPSRFADHATRLGICGRKLKRVALCVLSASSPRLCECDLKVYYCLLSHKKQTKKKPGGACSCTTANHLKPYLTAAVLTAPGSVVSTSLLVHTRAVTSVTVWNHLKRWDGFTYQIQHRLHNVPVVNLSDLDETD